MIDSREFLRGGVQRVDLGIGEDTRKEQEAVFFVALELGGGEFHVGKTRSRNVTNVAARIKQSDAETRGNFRNKCVTHDDPTNG